MKTFRMFIALSLVGPLTFAAAKLTAAEKSQHQKWQSYLNDMNASYAKYPVEMCGKALPITMSEEMVPAFMKAQNDASLYCEEVRTKLSTMCRNSDELKNGNKKKITTLVKKITCKLGSNENEVSFKISGGDLQVSLGAKAANISEELLKFLDATPDVK